jgi:hypothetical protein
MGYKQNALPAGERVLRDARSQPRGMLCSNPLANNRTGHNESTVVGLSPSCLVCHHRMDELTGLHIVRGHKSDRRVI